MARSKNSPALFEVIRNAQQKQKELLERQQQQKLNAELHAQSPAAALLRSPLYWFKGKHAHEAAHGANGANGVEPVTRDISATPAPAPVTAAPWSVPQPKKIVPVESTPVVPALEVETVESPVVTPLFEAPTYAPAPLSAAALAARQVREEIAAQEAPAAEPLFGTPSYDRTSIVSPFGVDADADEPRPRQFAIQLNYTSAIIAGFALLVAVGVAVIISTAGKPEEKVAVVAKSAVRPDVLNVERTPAKPNSNAVAPVAPVAPAVDDDVRASLANGSDAIGLDVFGKPIPVPTNVKRVVGYQYLVLLSFPREEDAKELVKYLAQNGVPATAEKALPGYAKSWTSVVSTRGFDHTRNNPAFTRYSDAIKAVLQKHPDMSKFRKTFKIDVYAWRTAS